MSKRREERADTQRAAYFDNPDGYYPPFTPLPEQSKERLAEEDRKKIEEVMA